MNIIVEVRSVYGNQAVYPACDTSRLLAKLAGTKTFTKSALDAIEKLGYAITVAQPKIEI
jgi:hypothetical protein